MLIKDATLIPDWLKEDLPKTCSYCGAEYQVGYSPNNLRVTSLYCPNRECPGTVMMKMVFMWTVLSVDGIKEGKSLELIKRHNIKRHTDAIPYLYKDKPTIDIVTFMRINCIKGIDSQWSTICADLNSIEEVIDRAQSKRIIDDLDKEDVLNAVKYFNIVFPDKAKHEPVLKMTVMMTGDIMGLPNRELLVSALNIKYDGLLDLRYSNSIRKTGISALIKESSSNVTGKVNVAKNYGIPIFTPEEFIFHIDKLIRERAGDSYDI